MISCILMHCAMAMFCHIVTAKMGENQSICVVVILDLLVVAFFVETAAVLSFVGGTINLFGFGGLGNMEVIG